MLQLAAEMLSLDGWAWLPIKFMYKKVNEKSSKEKKRPAQVNF